MNLGESVFQVERKTSHKGIKVGKSFPEGQYWNGNAFASLAPYVSKCLMWLIKLFRIVPLTLLTPPLALALWSFYLFCLGLTSFFPQYGKLSLIWNTSSSLCCQEWPHCTLSSPWPLQTHSSGLLKGPLIGCQTHPHLWQEMGPHKPLGSSFMTSFALIECQLSLLDDRLMRTGTYLYFFTLYPQCLVLFLSYCKHSIKMCCCERVKWINDWILKER